MLRIRVVQCLCTQCEGELLHLYSTLFNLIQTAVIKCVGLPITNALTLNGQVLYIILAADTTVLNQVISPKPSAARFYLIFVAVL